MKANITENINETLAAVALLPQKERFLLELLAVIYEPVSREKLFRCQGALEGRSSAQSQTSRQEQAALDPFLSHLVDLEYIVKMVHGGYQCHPRLMEPVFRELLRKERLGMIAAAVSTVFPPPANYLRGHYSLEGFDQAMRELRLALFTGKEVDSILSILYWCYQKHEARVSERSPLETILADPFPFDLVLALPLPVIALIVDALFTRRITRLEPLQELVTLIVESTKAQESNKLLFPLCLILLFRGELTAAAAFFPQLDEGEQTGFSAWSAFLLGENDQAIDGYERYLRIIKKHTGKKKCFPTSYSGIFFLLALIKSGSQEHLKQALTHVEYLVSSSHALQFFADALKGILVTRLGRPEEATVQKLPLTSTPQTHAFLFFIEALGYFWVTGKVPEKVRKQLVVLQEKATANQYPWLAAEAALLLARLGIDQEQNRKKAAAYHEATKTASIVDIVARREPWEHAIEAILTMAGMAPSPQDRSTGEGGASERLVWLLYHNSKHQDCAITPRLQKRDKKGVWSAGRAMALKTLAEGHETMSFLTPQDRQAVATLLGQYESGSYGYYGRKLVYDFDIPKTLLALAGHPHLYRDENGTLGTRIDLVKGMPELVIRKKAKAISLVLSHEPYTEWTSLAIEEENAARLRLIEFSDAHLRLAKLVAACANLPAKAEPKVREVLAAVAPLITIQSDIGAEAGELEEVTANPRPVVRLLPSGRGLRGEILVRPFTSGGPCYRPGAGGETVVAELAGKRVRAQRDLAREKQLYRELIARTPRIEEAMGGAAGEWQSEDPEDCLEMLQALQALGDSALLEWPEGGKIAIRKEVSFGNLALRISDAKQWFEANGTLQVDEALTLDLMEVLALTGGRVGRFIKLDENTFLALTREFASAIEDLGHVGEKGKNGIRFSPLAALALQDLFQAAGSCKASREWKSLAARLQETVDPSVPSTLQAELRDYQVTGFKWLAQLAHWGMGACLADDMGLGKTIQALAAILARAAAGPTLVVAPVSVLMNWREEAQRFAPTLNVKHFGQGDRKEMVAGLGPFDLMLTSYGLLLSETDLLASVTWQTAVLDEAQAIKNVEAKRSMAAMRLAAGFRIITSGTPVENHLGELWTLFQFLNPGHLGTAKHFQEHFAIPIEKDRNKEARDRLKKIVRPFILRRLKSQVLTELPPRTEIVIHVEPGKEEAALYEAQRRLSLARLATNGGEGRGNQAIKILAEITRLRRLCCNPQLVAPEAGVASGKLEAFGELLDELLEGRHKVLVFSQFVDHLTLIVELLRTRGITFQYLDGQTPQAERERRVKAFQNGVGDVFCISLKAGGTGLNLTAADYVIHMDPWWNPAVEDQASDRAHRIGQERPVTVYRLIMKGSIEERIIALHHRKRDLAESLLEGSDVAGRISPAELLGLIEGK